MNAEIIILAFCAWVLSVFAIKKFFDYEELLEEINGTDE